MTHNKYSLLLLFGLIFSVPHCSKRERPRVRRSEHAAAPVYKTAIVENNEAAKKALLPAMIKSGMPAAHTPTKGALPAIKHKNSYRPKPKKADPKETTKGALSVVAPPVKRLKKAHMPVAKKKKKDLKKLVAPKPIKKISSKTARIADEAEIDFEVENLTGETIYAACFAYMRKRVHSRWRWSKSPIYKIRNKQSIVVDIPTIKDRNDRKNVFGALGIYDNHKEANNATYELTHDKNKLDLDRLIDLKGKKVTIETERYGFKDPFLDYDFVDARKELTKIKGSTPELDFLVVNNTNKTVYICGFIYLKKAKGHWIAAIDEKDDMTTWRFDKTPVLKVKNGQTAYIDVDTIIPQRDRKNVLGYLGIFNKDEKNLAHKSTYELLNKNQKIQLGNLYRLKNKKVVLEIEQYGIKGDIIDYVVKPVRHIDWKKAIR